MNWCDLHEMYYRDGEKCPRCARQVTGQLQLRPTTVKDGAARRSPAEKIDKKTQAMQLLLERVSQTNKLTGSHHQVELREQNLVFVYCRIVTNVTFARAQTNPTLWRCLVDTLRYQDHPDLDSEMKSVISAIKDSGGEAYSFQL